MGKTVTVTCDRCSIELFVKDYYTLRIRSMKQGKQGMFPAFYLCPKCMRELRLETLVIPMAKEEEK